MDTQPGAAPAHQRVWRLPEEAGKGWSFLCAAALEDAEETTRMVHSQGEQKKENWNYLILTTWLRESQDSSR